VAVKQERKRRFVISLTLASWNRVHLEKLAVTNSVKQFLTFVEFQSTTPSSQIPATGPYAGTNELCPLRHNIVF